MSAPRYEKIVDKCPSCGSSGTLFVGEGGYLTCSFIECPEPGVGRKLTQLRVDIIKANEYGDHWQEIAQVETKKLESFRAELERETKFACEMRTAREGWRNTAEVAMARVRELSAENENTHAVALEHAIHCGNLIIENAEMRKAAKHCVKEGHRRNCPQLWNDSDKCACDYGFSAAVLAKYPEVKK